ncbi:MAG: PAS domain-containing protein [Thiovulaceae bacterium]|nr:PAS domain-containing protein [Sulfurimonadaceae bacterium]
MKKNIKVINKEYTFSKDTLLISKTDLKGVITYANDNFVNLVGYTEKELIGKPHNLVRHPDMPAFIFKYLWDELQKGNEVSAYVKNRAKDGGFYWVHANASPSIDNNGNIRGFHSTRRAPTKEAIDIIAPLYQQLLEAEEKGGIEASAKLITSILKKEGVSYDEFVVSI